MKYAIIAIAILLFAAAAGVNAAQPANQTRPIVLVFETTKGDGADKALAVSTTKAVCSYLRATQRVDPTAFDRESPIVQRAIMDKILTKDQVASYSSKDDRITVAKSLDYPYAAGAEVSVKSDLVQVKLWIAKTDGNKRDRWETAGSAVTGGTGDSNYDNAMQSAVSASVIQIERTALSQLPRISEKEPESSSNSIAIVPDMIAPPAAPTASDYISQADESLQSGNLAIAIQQYQQAVNADPGNAALRIKLSEAYARKGLYDDATTELDRAVKMGGDAGQIDAEKKRIEKMRGGHTDENAVVITAKPESPKTEAPASNNEAPASNSTTVDAVTKMREGDKLWGQGKPDDAAEAYKEAIKINPADWRAYERLAAVDASMSLFTESRKVIEQLNKVQPNPPADIVANRYEMFRKVVDRYFTMLFNQYDSDAADYAKHVITRESYYSSTKGLAARLEAMAKFLDAITVPQEKQSANLHRSLACGLVAQAAASLQDYLESNSDESKSNAQTFVAQAKKEIEAASKLDAGSAVVRQPASGSDMSSSDQSQPNPDPNAVQPDSSTDTQNPPPDAGTYQQ